jgi:hypothetical protein
MIKKTIFPIILFILLGLTSLNAQEEESVDLEKAIQNPIAAMYTLPFQNNTQFGVGEYDRTQNVLNIQPVIPIGLSKSVNMIVRTIIPVISQPIGEFDTKSGLGDIALSIFFTPRKPGKLIWGVGPAIGLPTLTDESLGSGKWSAGPAIIALIQPEGWTIGMTVQNTWSFAGNSDRKDVNAFYSQVFVVKNLKKGWYINSAPIITANWEAESGQEWLVPLGVGTGKLFRLGKLPINAQMGYYNYVVSPDNGPKWQLRAQINLLFPK